MKSLELSVSTKLGNSIYSDFFVKSILLTSVLIPGHKSSLFLYRRLRPYSSITRMLKYIIGGFYIGALVGYLKKFRLFGLGLRTSIKNFSTQVERLRIKTGRYRFLTYFNRNTKRVTIRCIKTRVYIRADAPDLVGNIFNHVATLVYKSIIYQFRDIMLRKITRVSGVKKYTSTSKKPFKLV